jgi:hypothetical protein
MKILNHTSAMDTRPQHRCFCHADGRIWVTGGERVVMRSQAALLLVCALGKSGKPAARSFYIPIGYFKLLQKH